MNEHTTTTGARHQVTIIVNTKPHEVPKDEITFDEAVNFAFGDVTGDDTVAFTVTYRHGGGHKPAGSLVEGDSVKVKDEMVFNVTRTNKS